MTKDHLDNLDGAPRLNTSRGSAWVLLGSRSLPSGDVNTTPHRFGSAAAARRRSMTTAQLEHLSHVQRNRGLLRRVVNPPGVAHRIGPDRVVARG